MKKKNYLNFEAVYKKSCNLNKSQGITLISLVIIIIILLILAGITIGVLTGENGLFSRAKEAKEKSQKEAAIEKINLVIADSYVKSYAERQENPTLQNIADSFCEDQETEYVDVQTRKISALEKIEIGQNEAIYVKLKKYPYEFKIDKNIKIATIDGDEISGESGGTSGSGTGGSTGSINSEEYKKMQENIEQLQKEVADLKDAKSKTEQELAKANDNIKSNKDQIDNMLTTLDVDTRTILFEGAAGTSGKTYTISDISEYKYIIIYSSFMNRANTVKLKGTAVLENVSKIEFSSNSRYYISEFSQTTTYCNLQFCFPSPTQLYITTVNHGDWNNYNICRIEGIK